jgi:hypothetical protein
MAEETRAPLEDEMYCPSCAAVIKREAEICVKCGVRLRREGAAAPKDKVVAILLAVFLAFFTWLYTYKRDAWKFWLAFALTLTVFNPIWTWIILFMPNFGIWIWAIVDVSVKPRSFYETYEA